MAYEELCKLYKDGLSVRDVSKQIGISKSAARNHLIKSGVKLRTKKEGIDLLWSNYNSCSIKLCKHCNVVKPISEFREDYRGRKYRCEPCHLAWVKTRHEAYKNQHKKWSNDYRLRKRGLTELEYNKILLSQNNSCAICKRSDSGAKGKTWFIDHDHKTGKTRALLCSKCNCMLGYAEDREETLLLAVEYLRRFK